MARLGLRGPLALDANCLSYLLLELDLERRRKMVAAFEDARDWGIQVSAVAISEVLVEPAQNGPRERFEDIASVIENSQMIRAINTDTRVARIGAEIRAARSLKLPDAIVVASAVAGGADLLLSNDRQVVRVAQDYLRAVYFDDWEPDAPESG